MMQQDEARSYEQCCATSLFLFHLLCDIHYTDVAQFKPAAKNPG
jgi:hypothetical protein